MPTRIVSREAVELVSVEHKCLPSGSTYSAHTNTGELSKGNLRWRSDGNIYYCPSCGDKLPRNISEVEETP